MIPLSRWQLHDGKDESLYKSLIFCDLVVCCLLDYRSLLGCMELRMMGLGESIGNYY